MDDQQRYQQARARVRHIKGFYIHATVYVLVNAFLIMVNLATSPSTRWSTWPLLGWGIGLGAHALAVFGLGGLWGSDWEQRKIQELLDKGKPR